MGKISGFMDYGREPMEKEPVHVRRKHFEEFEKPRHDLRVSTQAARCMGCGVPFCNFACPVQNLIPEFNDFVYGSHWKDAYGTLQSTNNFPEFTGRICPAPCEPACCTDIVETPITIKQIELAIIEKAFEKGWVKPHIVKKRSGYKIAIVGSGPAGLAAAQQLNLAGHNVTVFERHARLGGLLMYGIPDFKLEKRIIERRLKILEEEEIKFVTNTEIGTTLPAEKLLQEYDYVGLCCGAEEQNDLEIKNRNLNGIHYAMEYLTQQNRKIAGEKFTGEDIDAKGKHVIVVGGGDTGSDCVGTAIRQGCASMTQIQLHKEPPLERYPSNPWPEWPKVLLTSSSHEEGCNRVFASLSEEAVGENGRIKQLLVNHLKWPDGEIKSGQRNYKKSDEKESLPCDLLLIALGFKHTYHNNLIKSLDLKLNKRGNVEITDFRTSNEKIFAAGDMVEGANLVVTAIASGRKMASAIDRTLTGFTHLT